MISYDLPMISKGEHTDFHPCTLWARSVEVWRPVGTGKFLKTQKTIFGSSKNDPKSIGICPGVKISHVIENPQKTRQYYKKSRKNENRLICLLHFGPY